MSVGVHHLHPMSPAHLSPLVFSLTHAAPSLPVSVPHATCTPPGSGMPLYLLPPHVSCMLCPAYTHLAHSGLPHQVAQVPEDGLWQIFVQLPGGLLLELGALAQDGAITAHGRAMALLGK